MRTVKKTIYPEIPTIVGEDSGGWSVTKEKPMSLSIALSKTDSPNEFAEIATRYDWNTRGPKYDDKELKFRSSSDEVRESVLNEISSLDPEIYIATDERKLLKFDTPRRYKDLFKRVAEDMIKSSAEPVLEFNMDGSTFMKEATGERIVLGVAKGKKIRYLRMDSAEEAIIQTQDFVAGAANASRVGNDRFINIVRNSIKSWRIEK